MTAIAYRDGVMAADTMGVIDEHVKTLNETKIIKSRGYLIGLAGDDVPSNKDFLVWFFADESHGNKPKMAGYKFDAMVVSPNGDIQLWDQRGTFESIKSPFFAIGSGREVALGAMEAGASAPQAVAAAIKWSPTCGGKVITRRLGSK